MTKLLLKAQALEAWRYIHYLDAPLWVVSITEAKNGELLLVRQSGKQVINLGEWLVIDADNEVAHMTDAYVKRFYEVVG